ncbi:MAG: sialidase family protein [Eubacteriales bacterium]
MRKLFAILCALITILTAGSGSIAIGRYPVPDFTVKIAASALDIGGTGVAYGRVIELRHNGAANGMLIAVYEDYSVYQDSAAHPVYSSSDGGRSWEAAAFIKDLAHSGECVVKWQPEIYELPAAFGGMPEGTLLFAGVSIDINLNKTTKLQLYKSTDLGKTWGYLSTAATAGGLGSGIYEPELQLTDSGVLICYYSDETEKETHSQRIVYTTSADGSNWSGAAEVVALTNQGLRPGMPVVARLADGSWFMTYEMIGLNGEVYYKKSPDGLHWGPPCLKGHLIYALERDNLSVKKYTLACTPYCAWTPFGKNGQGTIVVTGLFVRGGTALSGEGSDYFASSDGGETWSRVRHPLPYRSGVDHAAYSNSLSFSADGKKMYSINSVPESDSDKCFITFASTNLDG